MLTMDKRIDTTHMLNATCVKSDSQGHGAGFMSMY